MEKEKYNRGGKRAGSGRPRNENKPYLIQCHPNCIDKVRLFCKKISNKENKLKNIDK